jgi:hypothetical protein
VIDCLETFLSQHGEGSMVEIARPHAYLSEWAMEIDTLGWDNLLEGRIGLCILQLQTTSMKSQGSRQHIKSWAIDFVHHLLGITHNQWLFRNARTHLRLLEGKSEFEHDEIMQKVGDLLLVDTNLLLPQHRQLFEIDFEKLGAGSTSDRQYWLANVESALQAFQMTPRQSSDNFPHLRRTPQAHTTL